VLVVCAVGNGGHDIDAAPEYPASFAFPNLVRVAATGRDGKISRMSNVGPRTVDIAAAGEGILSTAMGGGYERRSGTSLAAATVAGAAALLWAAAPSLDAQTLRAVLLQTARRRHRLPIAGGTLDLARAMRRARALSPRG
jgi:subtilisin family serine protease